MGIVKLAELIKEAAPDAVRPASLQEHNGQVVAVDLSVAIYQFRTAMPEIINRHGQNISALRGLFFRTLHLLENGLKPLFVFDGKPPELKQPVLAKRAALSGARRRRRGTAESDVPPRRDSETLLTLLGVPYIQAPAEAEATCAALVKSGHAWCAATEDLDALPFGALRLLRHLGVKKRLLEEISLPIVLQKLGVTQEQKHPVPDGWCLEEARRLFLQPEVTDPGQVVLEWKEPDEEGLVRFLVHEKHMKEIQVRGRLQRCRDARRKLSEEARGSVSKARGRPRKATKTMKDFFPVQKCPKKVPTRPTARKKPKLSETVPAI